MRPAKTQRLEEFLKEAIKIRRSDDRTTRLLKLCSLDGKHRMELEGLSKSVKNYRFD